MRTVVRARRKKILDRKKRSLLIFHHLQALSWWKRARTILVYMSISSEVETEPIISEILGNTFHEMRKCVIPWCHEDGHLELFHLSSLEELEAGTMKILEPKKVWKNAKERQVSISAVDLILLPGIAFDKKGGRLGQGKAFYDRLLSKISPQTKTVGLAFSCQMVPSVPCAEHDRPVDAVITEEGVFFSSETRTPEIF
ncbi:MAG: 5-formyltetrahydrofolate cyclo-ligase [Planctomycetia bacterium]|nr:5-formyltetrahydrofolate cyclo-ligase [Planctomycetia bacterium]